MFFHDWKIIESQPQDPQILMDQDFERLVHLPSNSPPILHFYNWSVPSITFGYFTNPYSYLDEEELIKSNLHLAKRPTGGGIMFHLYDLAFSVLIPTSHPAYSTNTLANYIFINQKVLEALKQFMQHKNFTLFHPSDCCQSNAAFCMAKPTIYDLFLDGFKVGGAAQRRMKQGFLHQGSICLKLPDKKLLNQIFIHQTLCEDIYNRSESLIQNVNEIEYLQQKNQLKKHLIATLTQ